MKISSLRDDIIEADGGIKGYHRTIRRKWIIIAGLFVVMLCLMVISVNAGSASMSP